MSKRITAKGGPLDGRTFDVPDTATELDHHVTADARGAYKVNAKTATWQPDGKVDTKPAKPIDG